MNEQLSMLNRNPETKVPYGYIAASSLHQEVVDTLMRGFQATDHTYQEAVVSLAVDKGFEATGDAAEDALAAGQFLDEQEQDPLNWWGNDLPEIEEPIITGTYEGVKYQTSWLGGALNFWIFESPVTTNKGRKASPCVPGACILDVLDGEEHGYDVPANWRYEAEVKHAS